LGELAEGVVGVVGGYYTAAFGVTLAIGGSETVVAVPAGATIATLGASSMLLGATKIADSFRDKNSPKLKSPGGVLEAVGEKTGGKKGKIVGEVADAVVGGKPGTIAEKVIAGISAINITNDALGEHSAKVKKSGMQQDHTKTVKPKPATESTVHGASGSW
jgi:hypothetical protein